MQISIILFLTAAYIIVAITVCVNSKHSQGSIFKSQLQKNKVSEDSQSKTIWSYGHQQNHNSGKSNATVKMSSTRISTSTTSPSNKEENPRTTENGENIDNHIEISTKRSTMLNHIIKHYNYETLKKCSEGFVLDAENKCVEVIVISDDDSSEVSTNNK